jgi:hypothetical protein
VRNLASVPLRLTHHRERAAVRCRTLILACLCLVLPSRARPADEPRKAGPDWWSLQPVRRPTAPAVTDATWGRNPIDAFVLAGLEARGLAPALAADRATLVRRATLDLTGLPPTAAEIDAFVNDPAPDAWEKVIERLLASPHYGERWGRHWLDVVRFGESQGFERDKPRDHAWRYRDYVIAALNADKPYDRFVREQIAGDVLAPVTAEGIVATGFLVCGPWDEVGATQQSAVMRRRVREEELEDTIAAVGQTFLGLTLNCARCHNHKFDPIPQRDYYRVKAALEGVRPGDRLLLTPEQARQRETRLARVAGLEKDIGAVEQAARAALLSRHNRPAEGVPQPMARWTFEADARDDLGGLDGTLHGGAAVVNGRLRLAGEGAYLATAPLPRALREKTLETWVALATLDQQGGGVISLETRDGRTFDAVVFGEREAGKWVAGSESFNRTHDLAAAPETAKPGELVHLAVVYGADGSITVYRNGRRYGDAYVPTGAKAGLRTYPAEESRVLIGLRHTGAGNGFLNGEVAEARLYDRALSPAEVAASFRAGAVEVPLAEVLQALTSEQRQQRERLLAEVARERAALAALPPALAYAANPVKPEPTFVLRRGDVDKPEEPVTAGALSAVKPLKADFGLPADAPEGERRRRLADWIASPDNPLTARVLVNRLWQYHFGRGLVASPSDFGFSGERPSHPELLDWLADDLVRSGWSVKHLHRLIMRSATYRQSGRPNPEAAAVDADDRLLWRFAPRRLEAEAVRDALLSVGGQLNPRMGGPSYRPFTVTVFNSTFYDLLDEATPETQRRTVYRMNVNSAKSPLLEGLDCPDPSVKAPRRAVTTTPLQALGLMNNAFVLRQARHFAARVAREAGDDPAARVVLAYRLAFGRPPSAAEKERAVAHVRDHGLDGLCWVLVNASEFLYLR